MTREETWLPVVGWEGLYEVSDLGRVRSIARTCSGRWGIRRVPERILKPSPNNHDVLSVGLYSDGKRTTQAVCRLVLEAFAGECPLGYDCCHWNDDRSDNRLSNLRWDTRAANQGDAVRNGRNSRANQTHCVHGHEFDSDNTYIAIRHSGRTRRICRACARIRARKPMAGVV